jgi:NADH:ubiquinone oxidoreductase subunit 6 (subunit J)
MRLFVLISPTVLLVAFAVVLLVHYWRVVLPMLAGMIGLAAVIKMLVPDPVQSIEVSAFVGAVIGLAASAWSRQRGPEATT